LNEISATEDIIRNKIVNLNKKGNELEEQLKVYEEALSGPEEIDSDTFLFKKIPPPN
jgi:hypothetical protein